MRVMMEGRMENEVDDPSAEVIHRMDGVELVSNLTLTLTLCIYMIFSFRSIFRQSRLVGNLELREKLLAGLRYSTTGWRVLQDVRRLIELTKQLSQLDGSCKRSRHLQPSDYLRKTDRQTYFLPSIPSSLLGGGVVAMWG